MYMKPLCSADSVQNGELFKLLPNVTSQRPLHKVWWSKTNNPRKIMSSNLDLFWEIHGINITQGGCDFLSSKSFINVNWSLQWCNQQIVLLETQNLPGPLCFGTNVRTNQAKIEKISISQVIGIWFLCSPVSTILWKANKSNLLFWEGPIG